MNYEELIKEIDDLTCTYHAFAIAIEGAECSNRQKLAQTLSKKYGAPMIHMADFHLPKPERPTKWQATPGAEVDFDRFNEEIATPWLKGKELVYSIYDEESGEIKERLALPNAQVYIIEGTYACHPSVLDFYDLRIFCAAGAGIDAREDTYFKTYMTAELADCVYDAECDL